MRARLGSVDVGAGRPVAVMGVINVSPESFHPGSVYRGEAAVLQAAQAMVDAGAALIDVGARSTAPYLSTDVGEPEETERLTRAVSALVAKVSVPVSADTTRAAVARAALEAGARVVNDVSALADPALAREAAAHDASLILMAAPDARRDDVTHRRHAEEPVEAVRKILHAALARARAAGVPDERVVLDPGIGFFRDEAIPWHAWDVAVLAGLAELADLGRPLCVGVSRKSFLGAVTGRERPEDRLAGSLAATTIAVLGGAAVVRTHDVRETVDAVRLAERAREIGRESRERRAHPQGGHE